MTTKEQLGWAYTSWSYAVERGYVYDSIARNVGKECFGLLTGGLVGIVASVGGVMVCSAAGAAAGAAIGGYFSAGNPAAAFAAAELGATIGRTIAETALAALGVGMLVYYMADHMWEIGNYAIAAYDIAVNQMPAFSGTAYTFLLDLSARWFAEAVGVFCGFLVFAIAMLCLARYAKSEKGQTRSQAVKDLFDTKLNEMCNGLVKWIIPKAEELRYSLQPAGKAKFAVINGGVGPDKMGMLQKVLIFSRRFMPRIVNASSRMVVFERFQDMDAYLRSEGFKITGVEEGYGPPGGQQIFYEKGNISCRVKTKGETGGPRERTPHISFGVNDGTGTTWYNDMAKITADGRLTFKLNTPVSRFKPTETITDPTKPTQQRYVGIQGGLDPTDGNAMQDAWAQNCHFNLPGPFDWRGLEPALVGVPRIVKAK